MKKKLLALYCRPPLLGLPQNSYGQYYILKSVSDSFETRILSFKSSASGFNDDEYFKTNDSKVKKVFNLILKSKSTRLTHYWSKDFFNAYELLLNDFKPDIVYVDNLLMMQYPARYTPGAKIWFYNDESQLFVKEFGLRKNIRELIRNIGLKKFEGKAISISERTFCITEEESNLLKDLGYSSIYTLPYPIDDDYYFYGWKPSNNKFTILFVGDFGHYPNEEAAKIICTKIIPAIKTKNIEFVLVGRNLIKIKKYLNNQIVVHENVDDVRPFYWNCNLFLAPIFSGAGMRIKILEAASCGIPILMTSVSNFGINLEKSKEAIIANNINELIENLNNIINSDYSYLLDMSKKANQKIKSAFSLDKLIPYYNDCLHN